MYKDSLKYKRVMNLVAVTFVIAIILYSCKEDIPTTDFTKGDDYPTQIVENMRVIQFSAGIPSYIVEAPLMERFSLAETPYDVFPKGIVLKGFTEDGLMETKIVADYAKHIVESKEEIWAAYGNVVVNNFLKGEKMETDTLYWNRLTQRIYTHSWVRLTTPEFFMQGYGMESDDMARNAVIKNPYDSYAIISRDSTEVLYRDTINFVGPIKRDRDE